MMVKSNRVEGHLRDLEEVFHILDESNMKLNQSKCHFGMNSRKFLGYMVTMRGIKASLGQRSSNREPLLLYLSVSSDNLSVVLDKELDEKEHPIFYVRKSLLDLETRYSLLEKLILALVTTSTKLMHYFETDTIHVKTHYLIKNVMRNQKPQVE